MKKLLFSLLFSTSLFAQYPSKHIIESDTVICVTPKQLTKINLSFVQLDFKTQLSDSFRTIIHKQDNTIKLQDINAKTCNSDLRIKQDIINNCQVLIADYKILDKKNSRQIRVLKLQRNILFIMFVSTIGFIIINH